MSLTVRPSTPVRPIVARKPVTAAKPVAAAPVVKAAAPKPVAKPEAMSPAVKNAITWGSAAAAGAAGAYAGNFVAFIVRYAMVHVPTAGAGFIYAIAPAVCIGVGAAALGGGAYALAKWATKKL